MTRGEGGGGRVWGWENAMVLECKNFDLQRCRSKWREKGKGVMVQLNLYGGGRGKCKAGMKRESFGAFKLDSLFVGGCKNDMIQNKL